MSDFIENLYLLTEEKLHPTFLHDPEYLRCKKESARLAEGIAADLGPDGQRRLDEFINAESSVDHFWQLAMFCQALALGLELGRLPHTLTV